MKQRATKSMQNFLRYVNLKMKKYKKLISEIINVKVFTCESSKDLFSQGMK